MSKWKCEICNSEFDNFQAQGFDNKIYCPLCYYKELYRKTEIERERLNNIINEIFEWMQNKYDNSDLTGFTVSFQELQDLKELKEGK